MVRMTGQGNTHVHVQGTKNDSCGREDDATYPIVREFHTRNHENATIARLPVIVADEGTLAGRAFALGDAGHAEANAFWLVEGSGVQDGNAIPAGLDLNWEVLLEALRRATIMEYSLEGRIFESCTVYVTSYPVIVEDGRTLGARISTIQRESGMKDAQVHRGTCNLRRT